jgi:O-methyltransferase domain/Dimerisation domain
MGDVLLLADIIELAQSFERAKVLLAAVELDLFTGLADGPLDRDALRDRIGIDERGARDFFDALVALGLLVRDRDGRYANTEATNTYLDRGKPNYIGALMEDLSARYYGVWGGLTVALRTGKPQGGAQATGDFPTLYADRTALHRFAASQAARSLPVAKALAAKFPWSQYRSVIDVGTSQGCVPVQVALAHPHITGGGFDLPQLHELFDAYVANHGLSERLRFHPGDFLRHPLPSADVLILGRVMHNWDRKTQMMLLKKAYDAIPTGGALVVYGRLIDDDRSSVDGLLSSLNMLLMSRGGSNFTGAECRNWMSTTGFRKTDVEPLMVDQTMIVALK